MKMKISMTIDRDLYKAYTDVFKNITEALGDREYTIPHGTIKVTMSNKWNNLLYLCHFTDEVDIKVEYEVEAEYVDAWTDLIVRSINILTQFKGMSEDFNKFLEMNVMDTQEVETTKL